MEEQSFYEIIGLERKVEDTIAAHTGPRIVLGKSSDGSIKPMYISSSQWEMLYWIWRLMDDESVKITDVLLEFLQS